MIENDEQALAALDYAADLINDPDAGIPLRAVHIYLTRRLAAPASHDAQPAVVGNGVRVKPLVWREHWAGSQEDIVAWRGENPLGILVDAEVPGQYELRWHREADPAALEAAKAQAQAAYDARVLSALTPAATPVPDAGIEAKLLTTGDLVRLLQQQDPSGYRIINFRICDEDDGAVVAHGQVSSIDTSIRDGQQTDEGDCDVLRLSLALDCH